MRRSPAFLALLVVLFATPIFSAPVITSITPSSGSTAGGTVVTIHGSGFETCVICSPPAPPEVRFGGIPATLVQFVDSNQLLVTTPPHLAGRVSVAVDQWNGRTWLPSAFVYEGDTPPSYERILVPLLIDPVGGAHGSLWITELNATNDGPADIVELWGVEYACYLGAPCPGSGSPHPIVGIEQGDELRDLVDAYPGTPGRFLFVPKEQLSSLSMNLRVYDSSRAALNFGTEIPIARESEMRSDRIVLNDIPGDPRFRNTLRIYATEAVTMLVTTAGAERLVSLRPGLNVFDPAYAQIGDLPVGPERMKVTVEKAPCPPISAPCLNESAKFWAFVSVTNNDTQMVTTISPQP